MIAILFTFLRKHAALGMIAAFVTSGLGIVLFQHVEVYRLRNHLERCRLENTVLETSNHKLIAALEAQNQALDTLAKASQALKRKAVAAERKGRRDAERASRRADAIMAQKSSGDACRDMHRMLNSFGGAGSGL